MNGEAENVSQYGLYSHAMYFKVARNDWSSQAF